VTHAAPRPPIGPLRALRTTGVVEQQLAAGLHVICARRPSVPVVELRLAFPLAADRIRRPADKTVLSESILSGTSRHDRAGLARAVQRIGGDLWASAAGESVHIGGSVVAEHLAEMLELVAEVLDDACYPRAEVSSDADRVADEVLMALSQPDVLADQELRKRLHPGHPYSSALPRPGEVRTVGAGRLRRLHAETLVPAAGHLVLVGDLTPARASAASQRALEGWLSRAPGSSTGAPTPLAPLPSLHLGPLLLFDRAGSVQSNLRLARLAPTRADPWLPAAVLANLVFGGMFASRLVDNLRERNGYTYSPRASINHARAGSTFVIQADVATGSTAASLVETNYELGRMATTGVTDAELESARRYVLGMLSFEAATQAGFANTLTRLAINGLSPGYPDSYAAALKRTTRREVDEAARRLLAPSQMVTVVLGDAEAVGPSLAAIEDLTPRALTSPE
jgi:predicted Zn-dependent peptidase